MRVSLAAVGGFSSSSCGYCNPRSEREDAKTTKKTSRSFYLFSYVLDPEAYQHLIDAGWRRSGDVLYKPDNSRTCCPQHPIRLPIDDFKTSRSQRRALKSLFWDIHAPEQGSRPMKKRGDDNAPFDLESFWRHTEWTDDDSNGQPRQGTDDEPAIDSWYTFPKRKRLRITLRAASVSEDKYQCYKSYQMAVHKDKESSLKLDSWKRFLVNNNFTTQSEIQDAGVVDLNSPEPISYGGYHQEWRLDGKLIAVGVLDILPSCVSSVYLYYDPQYEHLNLGKASALREILLVQQLRRKRGMEGIQYYYLGYWIANCQKMVYKGSFRPQLVLDTATNEWVPLDSVRSDLKAGVRFDFANPISSGPSRATVQIDNGKKSTPDQRTGDDDDEDDEPFSSRIPDPPPPGCRASTDIPSAEVDATPVLVQSNLFGSRLVPLGKTPHRSNPDTVAKITAARSALGDLASLFAFLT
ncbi:hypothetical protein V8E36_002328 [Tilletia maclaganii]